MLLIILEMAVYPGWWRIMKRERATVTSLQPPPEMEPIVVLADV